MLELTELAQFLTNKLNDNNYDLKFLIYSEVGKSQPNTICGVLKTSEPTTTPIEGINNVRYNAVVELAVSAPTSNYNLINVEKAIGRMIETYNGQEIKFKFGYGLVTFTFTRAKDYKMDYAVGETIPISFGVMVNYTEKMVTSATKHWQIRELNSQWKEIPFLSESVLLEKGGKTNNISDALYQQTLLTSQIKHYRFEIPYETNDSLCSMLQKDILQGDFGKKYELRYYDGVSFLQNDPFKTTVSIFSTGDSGSVRPDTAKLTVTFTDVDNGQNSIYYEMALVDDPFDTLSDNTQYFNSQQEQIDYFDELIAVGADYDEIPAPNLNSLNITNQVYLNTRKYDVFDLINKNHAIIKASYRDNSKTYYFHYKINNGDIGANGQVSFNLTLNTIQTYLFNPDLDIQGSFIQKSHLDRWIDNGNGTVTFNGKADSKLFEREEIKEIAKRLVSRAKLKYYTDTPSPTNPSDPNIPELVDKFNTIKCWCYVYISSGQYTARAIDGDTEVGITIENNKIGYSDGVDTYFEGSSGILCFPVVDDDGYKLYGREAKQKNPDSITYNRDTWISQQGFVNFANINSGVKTNGEAKGFWATVRSIKLSVKPPIDLSNIENYKSISLGTNNDGKVIYFNTPDYTTTREESEATDFIQIEYKDNNNEKGIIIIRSGSQNDAVNGLNTGIFYLTNDYTNPTLFTTTLQLPQVTFDKTTITGVNGVGVNKNKRFNPKLNASDYKNLTVTIAGNSYEFPIDKINSNKLVFEYFEPLSSDITKGLLRYRSDDNTKVFNTAYSQSFNGFSYTNDFSIGFSVSAYDTYIANNKNAYLSFQNQQNLASTQYAIRSANNILNMVKDPANLINSTQQILVDSVSTSVNMAYNQAQFNLSMDNMKAAPETAKNVNGSAILNYMVAEFGIYAELYEGLDTELEMANDIMFRDGYNYNRFDDLRSQLNIRRYFNYVKAVIGSLSGIPMSEESRKDFKQRFANGLRFWNKNEQNKFVIDYTKENYENRLV